MIPPLVDQYSELVLDLKKRLEDEQKAHEETKSQVTTLENELEAQSLSLALSSLKLKESEAEEQRLSLENASFKCVNLGFKAELDAQKAKIAEEAQSQIQDLEAEIEFLQANSQAQMEELLSKTEALAVAQNNISVFEARKRAEDEKAASKSTELMRLFNFQISKMSAQISDQKAQIEAQKAEIEAQKEKFLMEKGQVLEYNAELEAQIRDLKDALEAQKAQYQAQMAQNQAQTARNEAPEESKVDSLQSGLEAETAQNMTQKGFFEARKAEEKAKAKEIFRRLGLPKNGALQLGYEAEAAQNQAHRAQGQTVQAKTQPRARLAGKLTPIYPHRSLTKKKLTTLHEAQEQEMAQWADENAQNEAQAQTAQKEAQNKAEAQTSQAKIQKRRKIDYFKDNVTDEDFLDMFEAQEQEMARWVKEKALVDALNQARKARIAFQNKAETQKRRKIAYPKDSVTEEELLASQEQRMTQEQETARGKKLVDALNQAPRAQIAVRNDQAKEERRQKEVEIREKAEKVIKKAREEMESRRY